MSNTRSTHILYVGRRTRVANVIQETLSRPASAYHGAKHVDCAAGHPFAVELITNQKEALRSIKAQPPDVVLIETDQHRNARLRFCEMLRYRLPTAMLVAICNGEPDSEFEFDGVFQLPLDLKKVRVDLCEWLNKQTGHLLERGHIRLDVAARTVSTHNGQHHMTPKQCALLHLLMINHNTIVPRAAIMQAIWDTSYLDDTRTLDVHIRWLRERIEPDPSKPTYLITERGIGYRLSLA